MENKYFLKFKILGQIKDFTERFNYFESEDYSKPGRPRLIAATGIALGFLFFLILGLRLFSLQVQEGFINLSLAEGNHVRNLPVAAPRGLILDRNGKVLASNDLAYELVVQANRSRDVDDIDDQLFKTIGISKDVVKSAVEKGRNLSGFVTLKSNIPRDEALVLKSRLPAYGRFEVLPIFIRKYTDESLAHILGYVGKFSRQEQEQMPQYAVNKFIGKVGLEKEYDKYLQGKPGSRKVEVNASGKLIRILSSEEPQAGETVQTTIDLDLQKYIYQKLKEKTDELRTQGAVVAIDPSSGEIRAMVSLPGYDPTKMSQGLSEDEYKTLIENKTNPLLNRVISGIYPSGSAIKPFIASSALEFGVVSEDVAFDTPPEIKIGQWVFPDWKDHGYTDIKKAIAESNNIFFFALGGGWGPIKNGLGPEGIVKGLKRFGFGSRTGIDLTGEQQGFIPTPQWKKQTTGESWYIGDTYNLSIGQGDLLVTPLQVANATCVVANGGTLYIPHSVSKIFRTENELQVEFKPDGLIKNRNVFSANNLRIVREGMKATIDYGSAHSVFGSDFLVELAGKTGTAQYGNKNKTHAWFTSFVPYNNPELVLTVLIEGGGEGFEVAAPLARDVLRYYFEK